MVPRTVLTRPFNKITPATNSNFTKKVNTIKGTRVNTARPKAVLSAVKGNKGNGGLLYVYSTLINPLHHKFAGEVITIPPRIVREHEDYINRMSLLCGNSSSRSSENFHTIIEDSDYNREEIDIFSRPDDSIPPGIESDIDSEEDIIDNLLNDDPIPEFERLTFNMEPDVPMINNKDECFDPGGGEINVEVDDSFTFIILTFLPYLTYLEVSPLLSSTENEDTIFDPDIFAFHFSTQEPVVVKCFMEFCSSTCFIPKDEPKFSEDSRVSVALRFEYQVISWQKKTSPKPPIGLDTSRNDTLDARKHTRKGIFALNLLMIGSKQGPGLIGAFNRLGDLDSSFSAINTSISSLTKASSLGRSSYRE
ncbi:hypothetical protein Tco_1514958 [Tanacetum coccineum]